MTASRRYLAALASCIALVGLSVAFVDRPASAWSHATLHGVVYFDWLTHIVDPLVPASVAVLALAGAAAAFGGRRPGYWEKTLIECAVTLLVAVAIKDELKYAFGRTWPETWTHNNPSWITNGVCGFHPFHGGEGWGSFPSGHLTRITALAAVLWRRVSQWRWFWAMLVMLVAAGIYGADYHFIGDMIAGAYLGAACAAGVHSLMF